MSKNAANKRRAKRLHRLQFSPWYGADLEQLVVNIRPQATPLFSMLSGGKPIYSALDSDMKFGVFRG